MWNVFGGLDGRRACCSGLSALQGGREALSEQWKCSGEDGNDEGVGGGGCGSSSGEGGWLVDEAHGIGLVEEIPASRRYVTSERSECKAAGL